MAKRKTAWQVIVEQDEQGWYVAECPALRGCLTQGKTCEEAIERVKDVIAMSAETLRSSIGVRSTVRATDDTDRTDFNGSKRSASHRSDP